VSPSPGPAPLPAAEVAAALAPLRGLREATLQVAGRRVRLTHPDRALFPTGETKADLLAYLLAMAPVLLPHLEGRPLSLTRYPRGTAGRGFFQKNPPAGTPPWVPTAAVGRTRHLLARSAAELALFAQWSAVEVHVPAFRLGPGGRPEADRLVVDLDPMPPAGWSEVRRAAAGVRRVLEGAGVASYPKLSGATGLHVLVAVRPRPGGLTAAEIARGLGLLLCRAAPDLYTLAWRVARRRGVFVDCNQNAPGRTMAAPYSVRPGPRGPVSAPLAWDEVQEAVPQDFTLATVPDRVRRVGDLARGVLGPPEPVEPLEELAREVLGTASGRRRRSAGGDPGRRP
jgi:bifunctional non-homologous end joining protein LigD